MSGGRRTESSGIPAGFDPQWSKREAGISYVEVMIAMALIAIALVPAIDALRTSLGTGSGYATRLTEHYRVAGRLEDVLAEPFQDLDAAAVAAGSETVASSYSDAAGTPDRRLVYLARYDADDADGDGDPFTGGDVGLLWVRVVLEQGGSDLESLTTP